MIRETYQALGSTRTGVLSILDALSFRIVLVYLQIDADRLSSIL